MPEPAPAISEAPVLAFDAYGAPAPQGSKSAFPIWAGAKCPYCQRRHLARINQAESSKHVGPWRAAVAVYARQAMGPRRLLLDVPLAVSMVFTLPRPAGHYGTGRNAGTLKASAPLRPAGYPDVSKLARSTEDAMTTAGVWADDARVAEYTRLAKVFPGEDPDALARPGVRVTITPICAATGAVLLPLEDITHGQL